jgi:glycosyltransferase involved in cell wall biosynthesis
MTPPKVSICLPNLNNINFLNERLSSILNQSYQDWELIISDNYSDDGAWELFKTYADSDNRIRLHRAERKGMYENWNNCVRHIRGEYVYIATSDDTFSTDFLTATVAALDRNPCCDLAHCTLRPFGTEQETILDWWNNRSPFALTAKNYRDREHIRLAPLDGILHLQAESVYVSITQLLIRSRLFNRIGFFENEWGSQGDFHWNMKAGFSCNTIHIPGPWGGWRLHPSQATASSKSSQSHFDTSIKSMISAVHNRPWLNSTDNKDKAALSDNIKLSQGLLTILSISQNTLRDRILCARLLFNLCQNNKLTIDHKHLAYFIVSKPKHPLIALLRCICPSPLTSLLRFH